MCHAPVSENFQRENIVITQAENTFQNAILKLKKLCDYPGVNLKIILKMVNSNIDNKYKQFKYEQQ